MRRVLLALGLLLALPGCAAKPIAGDGNLVDDWQAVLEATVAPPPASACYTSPGGRAGGISVNGLPAVACAEEHTVETFKVAELPENMAGLPSAPAPDSADARLLFADCEHSAKQFLGDEWFTGRLYLYASLPSTRHWDGGARYYRCDLAETKSLLNTLVPRKGSLKGALTDKKPLAATCYEYVDVTDGAAKDLAAVDCLKPHDAEFAGTFLPVGDAMPAEGTAQEEVGFPGCTDVVATYLTGEKESMMVGVLYWGFSARDWGRGDRRLRCYATAPEGKRMLDSVKGIGNGVPQFG
ncbi:hypothetical protein Val02_93250 [Virgisporangium aliadipatigenens]|uniref:Septum formation-related domain-containing protein n=1 Tax=Virgisporangium aliadipatigenens TaxID=741659 RepID=A0A8J3YVH8_9ACTN|nr:septum formation family protein [Virgisporangium aliadipatigenens]GIJ52439.1 hypothetical protein Val02_93250 [Virgisporangium aliadipatigenens]